MFTKTLLLQTSYCDNSKQSMIGYQDNQHLNILSPTMTLKQSASRVHKSKPELNLIIIQKNNNYYSDINFQKGSV